MGASNTQIKKVILDYASRVHVSLRKSCKTCQILGLSVCPLPLPPHSCWHSPDPGWSFHVAPPSANNRERRRLWVQPWPPAGRSVRRPRPTASLRLHPAPGGWPKCARSRSGTMLSCSTLPFVSTPNNGVTGILGSFMLGLK